MANLVEQMIVLLGDLIASHDRMYSLAMARHDAMKAYDVEAMQSLMGKEQIEAHQLAELEKRRVELIRDFRGVLGRKAVINTTEIAKHAEPEDREKLLALAGKLRESIEKLDRLNKLNGRISAAVVNSIARVLKAITGMAQHAGLYKSNGKKMAVGKIHVIDAVA